MWRVESVCVHAVFCAFCFEHLHGVFSSWGWLARDGKDGRPVSPSPWCRCSVRLRKEEGVYVLCDTMV